MMNKIRMKSSYKTRTNKGQILHNLTYNKELVKQEVMDEIQQGFSSSRCTVKVLSSLKRGFPFMYTPPSTKASKLEEQFHNIADQLIKTYTSWAIFRRSESQIKSLLWSWAASVARRPRTGRSA